MARGESPYKGHYTVPTIDFSPIERGGAAWGEAFKGIGEQIEQYGLKKEEQKIVKGKLAGWKLRAKGLMGEIKAGVYSEDEAKNTRMSKTVKELIDMVENNPDASDKQKIATYETGLPALRLGINALMKGEQHKLEHPPTGAWKFRKSLVPPSAAQTSAPPPDLAVLGGASGGVEPTAPAVPPSTQVPTAAPVPTAPITAPTTASTAPAPQPPIGEPAPPVALTPTQQRLLDWGRQNPSQVDASIRPQLNAAREKEEAIRNYPVELQAFRSKEQEYAKAGVALEQAQFDLKQDKQPGMTLEQAKNEGSAIKEQFKDHKLNLNYVRKSDGTYQITFNATPKGPTVTMVTAEVDGDTVKLPLWTNGTDYFVVDEFATDPKDMLKNIGDDPNKAAPAYRGMLEASITSKGGGELGLDSDGNKYNVREFRDLMVGLESYGETWPSDYITRTFGEEKGDPYSTWELDMPLRGEGEKALAWGDIVFETREEMDNAFKKARELTENEQRLQNLPAGYPMHHRTPQTAPTGEGEDVPIEELRERTRHL